MEDAVYHAIKDRQRQLERSSESCHDARTHAGTHTHFSSQCHMVADSVGFLNYGFMIHAITNYCYMNCSTKGCLEYSCLPEKQGVEGQL